MQLLQGLWGFGALDTTCSNSVVDRCGSVNPAEAEAAEVAGPVESMGSISDMSNGATEGGIESCGEGTRETGGTATEHTSPSLQT